MKRFTTIGLIAVIAVMILLAGCGKKAQEPAVTDAAKPVEAPKAPEAPAAATVEAKPAEAAPAAEEPVQASDLDIDEKELDLGDNPDTGASSDLDVPTLE